MYVMNYEVDSDADLQILLACIPLQLSAEGIYAGGVSIATECPIHTIL
jgi:hypothetical protein